MEKYTNGQMTRWMGDGGWGWGRGAEVGEGWLAGDGEGDR